jgi:hypothetical protein
MDVTSIKFFISPSPASNQKADRSKCHMTSKKPLSWWKVGFEYVTDMDEGKTLRKRK